MCDLIFSGVFERHPRLRVAIVEFELAWAPHLLSTMDYTYRERHGEAIYRFKGLPSRRRGACPREGGGRHAPERLLPPQRRAELFDVAVFCDSDDTHTANIRYFAYIRLER